METFRGVFHHPFSLVACGPTSSAKTRWIWKLIASDKVQPSPRQILHFCRHKNAAEAPAVQHVIQTIKIPVRVEEGLKYKDGDEDRKEVVDELRNSLILIDDLADSPAESRFVCILFTVLRAHANVSVVLFTQNLFLRSKFMRSISLNAQFVVLFRSPRATLQLSMLGREVFADKSGDKHTGFLAQAWNAATKERVYSYLVIDMRVNVSDDFRVFTDIFSEEYPGLSSVRFFLPLM